MFFYYDKRPDGYWYRFAGDHDHTRRIARPCGDECQHRSADEAHHHYCEHLRQRLQLTPGANWPTCSVPDCPEGAIATLKAPEQTVGWCCCEGHSDPKTLPLDRMCARGNVG